jgi:hypothetical protein
MSEQRILRDADGDWYALPIDALTENDVGTFAVDESALVAARLPNEVGGYLGSPSPGVDIIVKKHPGSIMASFTDFGTQKPSYVDPYPFRK